MSSAMVVLRTGETMAGIEMVATKATTWVEADTNQEVAVAMIEGV